MMMIIRVEVTIMMTAEIMIIILLMIIKYEKNKKKESNRKVLTQTTVKDIISYHICIEVNDSIQLAFMLFSTNILYYFIT